jgi:hypothetical protein
MLKGNRFIWYYWSQALHTEVLEFDEYYEFIGKLSCYKYLSKKIIHKRKIKIYKQDHRWVFTDEIKGKPQDCAMRQLWHLNKSNDVSFISTAEEKECLAFNSLYYGSKQTIIQKEFVTTQNLIETSIKINN